MSKQNPHEDFNLDGSIVIPVDIEKEMKKSYLEYSMSVIVGRALPDVRDGLKPVHRRILFRMHEMGLRPDTAYRKCADIVGSVLGRYHPHGDASVYDALVRMAQDFSMRYPTVDGHGNFGSVDGDPAAAYRYTEARMSKISQLLLEDIGEETVDTRPNYDDRLQEPIVLPARFPHLLVNGSSGIAVGMATNIPPHNLGETVAAVCHLIDNPEATTKELMEHIKGPDFPTGGIIMGKGGIYQAYETGRGKITLRAKAEILEKTNGRLAILVTEIPYQVNKSRLIENMADIVNSKRLEGISNILDESSQRVGLRIMIDLKRDANPQLVLNQLFQLTQLQVTFGVIMLAIVDGIKPKVLSLKDVLNHYIKFQIEIVRRKAIFQLRKAKEREHIVTGLLKALDIIDEIIAVIRASKVNPRDRIMEVFGFDEIQATAIVSMRLAQLSALERDKLEDEIGELRAKILELKTILESDEKVLSIIKEDSLATGEKFKDERLTEIVNVSGDINAEDLILEEDCVITLTHYGYIKRQPIDVYKTQRRGGRGVSGMTRREDDFVEELFISSSHDYVMFFTDKGKMYRLKCYEIPEGSRGSRGTNVINILPLEDGEQVKAMIPIRDIEEEGRYITMITAGGIIKRTELLAYRNVRKTGVRSIVLDEDDSLVFVRLTNDEDDLIVATEMGKAIRFNQGDDLRAMGRTTRGVKAISLSEGDRVVGLALPSSGEEILTITENGYGRRTDTSEYRLQRRGGKGSINYKVNKDKGKVVGVRTVCAGQDVIIIADNGVIIRFDAAEISNYSRYSAGVRAMRLMDDSKIVTFACALKEDEEEAYEEGSTDEELISEEVAETVIEELSSEGED